MQILSPLLKAQIRKEMLCILRDPRSRFVLIGPPLLQLLLFSFAATLDVRNVHIGVLDRDNGHWSYEVTERLSAAQFVEKLHFAPDRGALQRMIGRQDIIVALDIPPTFSRDIAADRPAAIQVIIDGRRANAGQITLGYLNSLLGNLGVELATGGALADQPTVVRHWFNPNLIYQWFIVPGLAGILVTFITLLLTALSIARERELGTFDQLLVSPTTSRQIIIAKSLPAMIICSGLCLLMVSAAVFFFHVPYTGSFWMLFISLELFLLSLSGIGLMVSSVCATQQQAILGTFALGVPMILMSGFATPVENMPRFLQWLAQAVPLKHFLIIVEGSFVKALPPVEIFANAWPMAVIAIVTLLGAIVAVRYFLK